MITKWYELKEVESHPGFHPVLFMWCWEDNSIHQISESMGVVEIPNSYGTTTSCDSYYQVKNLATESEVFGEGMFNRDDDFWTEYVISDNLEDLKDKVSNYLMLQELIK